MSRAEAPPRKRFRLRWLIVLCVVLAAVVGVTAIVTETPNAAQAVGVWQRDDSDMRIVIYPSGKITFANIPKAVIDSEGTNDDGNSQPVTVSGTWTPFTNYWFLGGVSSGYLADGTAGKVFSRGNILTGRQLVLIYGGTKLSEYVFHRVSTSP